MERMGKETKIRADREGGHKLPNLLEEGKGWTSAELVFWAGDWHAFSGGWIMEEGCEERIGGDTADEVSFSYSVFVFTAPTVYILSDVFVLLMGLIKVANMLPAPAMQAGSNGVQADAPGGCWFGPTWFW
jgi:hypothetical protein